ncbi:MAG: glycerophosphodiester phosphodiesterase family protein [Marinobacterium sp.]|nr:glycerophosphodiester phosphodiesterase family protein [Marinobacterium sp.]
MPDLPLPAAPAASISSMPLIYGHRGIPSRAPENTLGGFLAAIREGVEGVELDVTLLADGTPVVNHDADLSRCSDHDGLLCELLPGELIGINNAVRFADWPVEPVPLLIDVIALLNRYQLRLNLELKDHGLPPAQVAAAVVPLLRHFHDPQKLVISSFSYPLLQACRQLCSLTRLGLLYGQLPENHQLTEQARALDARSVHVDWRNISHSQLAALQAARLKLWLWTVDDPDSLSPELYAAAEVIISNCPQHFLSDRPPTHSML